MKRMAIAIVTLAIGAAGCGSSNSTPTTPSNTTIYTVTLLPSNETPPISNAEQSGRGTAVITIHKDTNTVDFNVSMNSFPAGSSAILAHIHGPNGPAGVAANVFINTTLSPGTAVPMPNGSATFSFNGIAASADQITQILANPSQFYFNVHTPVNPGGAIRGQLK
jgi:hypothetical protein